MLLYYFFFFFLKLLTLFFEIAGEDGQIKIWSRTGMLRSTLVTATVPLYCASFNPDGSQLVYPIGSQLIIKPLAPHSRPIRWKVFNFILYEISIYLKSSYIFIKKINNNKLVIIY